MKAAAALAAILLALLIAEGFVRLLISEKALNRQKMGIQSYHLSRGWENVPGTEEGLNRINQLGYRDREFSRQKPKGTKRILFVGDSVVFGTGVPLEDTFVKQLEQKLRRRYSEPIEVINGGNPDVGTAEMLRIFQKRDIPTQPDLLLLCFYMNDSRPPMGFRSEFIRGSPVVRFVKTHPGVMASRLFALGYTMFFRWGIEHEFLSLPVSRRMVWKEMYDRADWRHDPATENELIAEAQFDWGAAWRPQTWGPVIEELRKFDRLCRQDQIRPVLFASPVSVQVYGAKKRSEPQHKLAKIARNLGWPFLDLLPALLAVRSNPHLFNDHCHYSPEGHRVVSEALYQFMEEHGLLHSE